MGEYIIEGVIILIQILIIYISLLIIYKIQFSNKNKLIEVL